MNNIKKLGIFGTSGFSREVADIAVELGYSVIFIAQDEMELKAWTFPDEIILESDVLKQVDITFAIGIGDNAVREKVAQRFDDKLSFVNLIHPSASFGRGQLQIIEAKKGVVVCSGVRFTNNILVGNFTIFNLNATLGHDVIVEDYVNVAPGANISGNVHLGVRSWVGSGAVINQGTMGGKIIIGEDTVIGSGSMVTKHCNPKSIYFGIPARKIK